MKRTGSDRTEPDWTRSDQTEPDRTGTDWTGMDRTGPDWTVPDRTGPEWTGMDRTGLDQMANGWREPPPRYLRDRGGGMCGPTKRGVPQGGDPTGLELGAGWIEVALARCQTKAGSHFGDTA
jgi:hypothetical protein